MKEIRVQINPYLEYIDSLLLTGKYNEITMPVVGYGLMTDEINEYTTGIKQLFENHRSHPVYSLIEAMIPEGFTFSRPVELALSIGKDGEFSMQYALSDFCMTCCGGRLRIEELLRQMKDLEKETEFFSFCHKNKGFYDSYLNKAREVAEAYPYVTLLEHEYGVTKSSYQLVISSLMRGNFGIVFEDEEMKQPHLYAVLSTHGFSLSPNILFHEFSHPFINPLTEKYDAVVTQYREAYERLKPYKLPGFASGYGEWQECVNEHLVRAMVIHLLQKCNLCEEATEQLHQDLYCGYRYIPLLLESYEYYDRNRETYPDFETYYPELLQVFREKIEEV